MRAVLIDESTKVYPEPSDESISMATLQKGEEFELGKVIRKKREVWVTITLSSGQEGYISGNTKIFGFKKVQLLNTFEDMIDKPGEESAVVKSYPKNTILNAIGVEKVGDDSWVKVKDEDGVEGFIRGNAKIRVYQEPSKENAKKQMLTGALFAVAGLIFYFLNNAQTSTQSDSTANYSLLTMVLIALGAIQMIQGYTERQKAVKIEKDKANKSDPQ